MNVVCYERGLLWTGLLWTWSVMDGSVMNVVYYERVSSELVCYQHYLLLTWSVINESAVS